MEEQGLQCFRCLARGSSFVIYSAQSLSSISVCPSGGQRWYCCVCGHLRDRFAIWSGPGHLQHPLKWKWCFLASCWKGELPSSQSHPQVLLRDFPLSVLTCLLFGSARKKGGLLFQEGQKVKSKKMEYPRFYREDLICRIKPSLGSDRAPWGWQQLSWCLLGLNGFRMGPMLCRRCNPPLGPWLNSEALWSTANS